MHTQWVERFITSCRGYIFALIPAGEWPSLCAPGLSRPELGPGTALAVELLIALFIFTVCRN
jgi:hypothetical protein